MTSNTLKPLKGLLRQKLKKYQDPHIESIKHSKRRNEIIVRVINKYGAYYANLRFKLDGRDKVEVMNFVMYIWEKILWPEKENSTTL